MTVSTGFYKKIQQWIVDADSKKIAFRPFQVDGNPYKSKVAIVGYQPEPIQTIDKLNLKLFADSLVDFSLFDKLMDAKTLSREYKGVLNFARWMKKQNNEDVVITNVNCYSGENKGTDEQYIQGFKVFEEVINEFSPEVMVIHGSKAFKAFLEAFPERIVEQVDSMKSDSVQQLEQKGVIAKYLLSNGSHVKVVVCRSMTHFGKEGTSFGELKETLNELIR